MGQSDNNIESVGVWVQCFLISKYIWKKCFKEICGNPPLLLFASYENG